MEAVDSAPPDQLHIGPSFSTRRRLSSRNSFHPNSTETSPNLRVAMPHCHNASEVCDDGEESKRRRGDVSPACNVACRCPVGRRRRCATVRAHSAE